MQAYTSPGRISGFVGKRLIWCLGVVVVAATVLTGFFYNRHEIRIFADGKEISLVMRGGTVQDALKTAGISLDKRDIVTPPVATKLTQDQNINITRMIKFTLQADGEVTEYWTAPGSVEQAFQKLNIAVNPGDQVLPGLQEKLSPNDKVEIVRYSSKYINQSVNIPFKTERRSDNTMERGNNRVVTIGQNGVIQRTLKITLKNGREIKREVINEKTVRQPVNKVVAVGTMRTKTVSRGDNIRFSRSLRMNASAYSHTGNRTASGTHPSRGTVAVDPRVIPLGSRLYIEGYGYATALDVGSAIKGNKIDLFFDSTSQAKRWGRRPVTVYVLK